MHTHRPLEGKVIIDLSHRLPGPVCGMLLANLGAKVIKIEDQKFKDPFIQGLFAEMDNSFPVWYEKINANKEIRRFDFSSADDQLEIQNLVKNSDAIIMAIPNKVQEKLGVDLESLRKLNKPISVVFPKASQKDVHHMHDLNAMAMTGLLTLHAQTSAEEDLAPPFLPIAGINFGQKMAMDLLATMLKAASTKTVETVESFLLEATEEVYGPFWPSELRDHNLFLHNGLYPCYNIYKTSDDHFVVMACVEEKFWAEFCEAFSFKSTMEQRFETSGEVHDSLKTLFRALSVSEVEKKLGSRDICINILHRTDK